MGKKKKIKMKFWELMLWSFYAKMDKRQLESYLHIDVSSRLNFWVIEHFDMDTPLNGTIKVKSVYKVIGVAPKRKAIVTANFEAEYVDNILTDFWLTEDIKIKDYGK